MSEFVSEPILPLPGTFDAASMARGEPGLPRGFTWRCRSLEIVQRLEAWKESSREGGSAEGQLYLRRHYYRLRMSDGTIWTVYFVRQSPRGADSKARWFLYGLEQGEQAERADVC